MSDLKPLMSESDLSRFFSRVTKTDSCWLWNGLVKSKNQPYGKIYHSGKMRYAHRLIWEHKHGKINHSEIHVCHKCDNPSCVNPKHLFVGKAKDNMHDAIDKKRFPHRDTHGMCKLNSMDIDKIFELRHQGKTYSEISKYYDVSSAHIGQILKGKRWKKNIKKN